MLKVRVMKCFEAAALATGCEMKKEWVMGYSDLRNSQALSNVYTDFMSTRFDVRFPAEVSIGGSTDFVSSTAFLLFAFPCSSDLPLQGNGAIEFLALALSNASADWLTLLSKLRAPGAPPCFCHSMWDRRREPHGRVHQSDRTAKVAPARS